MNAKKIDKIAISTLYVIAGIIVTILAALILYILVRGIPHISWSFLTSRSSSYKAGGGIGVQLYNSFFLLVITLIISVPLSMGAGIFLSEYAKKGRLTNFVRTCIEILSSLPSVVVGLFGYLIFVVQFQYGFSILSGALALTVFNLPQMTRTVEDSLRTVHHTQREAGLALGLSRWETIYTLLFQRPYLGLLLVSFLLLVVFSGKQQRLSIQQVNRHQHLTGATGIRLVSLVQSRFSAKQKHLLFTSGRSTQKVRHLTPLQYQLVQQQYS